MFGKKKFCYELMWKRHRKDGLAIIMYTVKSKHENTLKHVTKTELTEVKIRRKNKLLCSYSKRVRCVMFPNGQMYRIVMIWQEMARIINYLRKHWPLSVKRPRFASRQSFHPVVRGPSRSYVRLS